jgi:hypothetical protein
VWVVSRYCGTDSVEFVTNQLQSLLEEMNERESKRNENEFSLIELGKYLFTTLYTIRGNAF